MRRSASTTPTWARGTPFPRRVRAPLLPYIAKIVRNVSLNAYWKKAAAKRNSRYTVALEELETCFADSRTVETEIEAREFARIRGKMRRYLQEREGFL